MLPNVFARVLARSGDRDRIESGASGGLLDGRRRRGGGVPCGAAPVSCEPPSGSLRRSGLTPQRYLLLLMIKGAPDGSEQSTVTELAERLQLAQSTVTELVSRAMSTGLIDREQSVLDARVAHLRLTGEGERRLDAGVHDACGRAVERARGVRAPRRGAPDLGTRVSPAVSRASRAPLPELDDPEPAVSTTSQFVVLSAGSTITRSRPAPQSTTSRSLSSARIVSDPSPPRSRSAPEPPVMMSLPAPPSMRSVPAPPRIVSLPPLPRISSSCPPPARYSPLPVPTMRRPFTCGGVAEIGSVGSDCVTSLP